MIEAIRIEDRIEVRGVTIFAELALAVADQLDITALDRPGSGSPLVTASEDDLIADPLLRLEMESASAAAAQRLADTEAENHQVAIGLLTRWATCGAEYFIDTVAVDQAGQLSAWANRIYLDLRMTELEAHGVEVTVGGSDGMADLLAALDGPAADPNGDADDHDDLPREGNQPGISPAPMLFASVATTLSMAIAGLQM